MPGPTSPTRSRAAGGLTIARSRATALTATATSGVLAWLAISADRRQDTAASLLNLPWHTALIVAALVILGAAHYIAAAMSVRAVSNGHVGLKTSAYAQLAAASVNRVIPGGLGALGVNLRFLTRSGLAPGAAASALGALAMLGGATDALFVGGVTTLGPHLGVSGATTELHALTSAGLAAGQRHSSLIIVAVAVILFAVWRRRGGPLRKLRAGLHHAATHAQSLVRRPHQLAGATAASLATTAALSAAFVLAVRTWGSAAHAMPVGSLIALYWVATAAGTATPLPAFVGVAEAALVSGLVLGGYTSVSALLTVLVFRGVTYWLPVPLGVWAGRTLRREHRL